MIPCVDILHHWEFPYSGKDSIHLQHLLDFKTSATLSSRAYWRNPWGDISHTWDTFYCPVFLVPLIIHLFQALQVYLAHQQNQKEDKRASPLGLGAPEMLGLTGVPLSDSLWRTIRAGIVSWFSYGPGVPFVQVVRFSRLLNALLTKNQNHHQMARE